jgi:hypothetical protein
VGVIWQNGVVGSRKKRKFTHFFKKCLFITGLKISPHPREVHGPGFSPSQGWQENRNSGEKKYIQTKVGKEK